MKNTKMELNITWLYPKEMSTYGDRGNILTLKKRGEWRDIKVNVEESGLGEPLKDGWTDLYFFGGGQDQAQNIVSEDLIRHKKHQLLEESQSKVFLGICGGYQLFGHYYRNWQGQEILGLGILDIYTLAGKERMMGNIVVESDFLREKLVGFENHSGKTFLGPKSSKLGKVLLGKGNNGKDRTEGAVEKNIFGCYLHGPLLPKNPFFADYLMKTALQNKYGEVELAFINDTVELTAHERAIERAYKTRSRMVFLKDLV